MKKETKKLTFIEIASTITISYLCASYFNADFNPFHWASHVRFMQVAFGGMSLLIQYGIKNDNF